MKKSLFIAIVLSVIATGSLYANDVATTNVKVGNAPSIVEFAADVILAHAPRHYGHPEVCGHHMPPRVKHCDDCCHHNHLCCPPPPAPKHGKPHKFSNGAHYGGHGHNIDKPHRPNDKRNHNGSKYDRPSGKKGGKNREEGRR